MKTEAKMTHFPLNMCVLEFLEVLKLLTCVCERSGCARSFFLKDLFFSLRSDVLSGRRTNWVFIGCVNIFHEGLGSC